MASGLFSSIQSLSTKLLEAIRGTPSTSHHQDPPVTDQNKSVREDLEKLSRMLRRIQAVQQDAEEREIYDRSVHLWLEELRSVGYQAEDVLDEFYYEVLKSIVESGDAALEAYHRDGGIKRKFAEMYTSSSLASKLLIPDGLAEKIKGITERFREISNARRDLHLKEEDGTWLLILKFDHQLALMWMRELFLVGTRRWIRSLASWTLQMVQILWFFPLLEWAGSARPHLPNLFSMTLGFMGCLIRCWVSVSEDFDLVRLTKAIIDSLSEKREKSYEFSELNILQDILKEKIRGHDLFLVLDDVWNEKRNLWECFRVGFHGAMSVRILMTTRNTSVAKIMQTKSPIQLSSLPKSNCWSLFKHFAFGNRETSENANLHEIGRGIVEKCKGSPLAIKALGGILRYEMDEEKWREILESDISEIDERGEVMPALRLSYQKLPQHLKPCFLYLSMFPKDTKFEKDMVVRLWMAQGYINRNTRNLKTLEEMGSEYFDELQGRSLVDGGPSYYMLHDLIHDLARSVSQEAYWPVLENDQQCIGICKVYHLFLTEHDKLLGSFFSPSDYCSIRTFVESWPEQNLDFAFSYEFACATALKLRFSLFPNTLSMLKHLRYLYIENCHMETLPETFCLLYNLQSLHLGCHYLRELPENIKNLINLRYFQRSSGAILQLPKSIFLLHNLHTLSLRYCKKLKELPRGIEQLTRLRILDLPESLIYMPCGIGKLTTLKLIGDFSVMDHGMVGGLGELKDMNKLSGLLCITGLRNISDVEHSRNANLASKPNLYELILNFQEDDIIRSCTYKGLLPLAVHSRKNERNKNYQWAQDVVPQSHLHLTISSSKNANNENDEKIQDVVLQSLQPHGNLTELAILNYVGQIFPSWLLNPLLPKLTTLTLNFWIEPNLLPPFGQLPHLRFLDISGNAGVRNVRDEPSTYSLLVEYDSFEQPKKPSFPSLEVLSLRNMLNLVKCQGHDGDFPRLKQLTIENCPKLSKITIIAQEVREVTFMHCPKLKFLTCPSVISNLTIHTCGFREIMFQSVSETLKFSNCVELISINWSDMGLNSVREVSFEYCPKLEFITIPVGIINMKIHECGFREIMFRSVCENLKISKCVDLFSINWTDGSLNSVELVTSECCSKLKLPFPVKNVLHSMTQRAEIYDCPRLNLGKGYAYQRDPAIDGELTWCWNGGQIQLAGISTFPLVENSFALFLTKGDLLELESLTLAPSVGMSCQHISVPSSLVKVNIHRCREVISVTGLDNLSNLKCLSISYCPELCNWNDQTVPLSLKFLELDSCDKLSSLPLLLVQNHSSTLKELVIKKCPRLAVLESFQSLTKLKYVDIRHCRNISISHSCLQFVPHITLCDCPLIEDCCQRNNISFFKGRAFF